MNWQTKFNMRFTFGTGILVSLVTFTVSVASAASPSAVGSTAGLITLLRTLAHSAIIWNARKEARPSTGVCYSLIPPGSFYFTLILVSLSFVAWVLCVVAAGEAGRVGRASGPAIVAVFLGMFEGAYMYMMVKGIRQAKDGGDRQSVVGNTVETVATNVQPVVQVVSGLPAIEDTLPVHIVDAPPFIENSQPVVEVAPIIIEDTQPVARDVRPVAENAELVAGDVHPVIQNVQLVIDDPEPGAVDGQLVGRNTQPAIGDMQAVTGPEENDVEMEELPPPYTLFGSS